MDATRGGDQAVGQIPLQLAANADKPAREQQKPATKGLLEGMAVGGPNLEGRGYALELLDEMGAVEERLCAEMAQFEIALPALAEVGGVAFRSEEHTSELQPLMRNPYAVFRRQHTILLLLY